MTITAQPVPGLEQLSPHFALPGSIPYIDESRAWEIRAARLALTDPETKLVTHDVPLEALEATSRAATTLREAGWRVCRFILELDRRITNNPEPPGAELSALTPTSTDALGDGLRVSSFMELIRSIPEDSQDQETNKARQEIMDNLTEEGNEAYQNATPDAQITAIFAGKAENIYVQEAESPQLGPLEVDPTVPSHFQRTHVFWEHMEAGRALYATLWRTSLEGLGIRVSIQEPEQA